MQDFSVFPNWNNLDCGWAQQGLYGKTYLHCHSRHICYWLINSTFSLQIDSGLLTPTMKVQKDKSCGSVRGENRESVQVNLLSRNLEKHFRRQEIYMKEVLQCIDRSPVQCFFSPFLGQFLTVSSNIIY